MFAVIYQMHLKPGRESDYKQTWHKVVAYFVECRGAIGSSLHLSESGLWVAYSRWPDKATRDASWPVSNIPSSEVPEDINQAFLIMKDCTESTLPEICLEVVDDFLFPQESNMKQLLEDVTVPDKNPTVAIIGAGPSGLVSAKFALEYGFETVVFEQNAFLGGLWNPSTGATWTSMRTNLSKFSCMFTDLPWEQSADVFPLQSELYNYLCAYSAKFNLEKNIRFNSPVINVKQDASKWEITWRDKNLVQMKERFDFVIIATGSFSETYIPPFQGLEKFEGVHLHAKNYKSPQQLKGERVAVVGSSFSGTEISVDIAKEGKSVVNFINNPHWILPRYIPLNPANHTFKLPVDLVFYKRATRKQQAEIKFKTSDDNRRTHAYMSSICKDQAIASQNLAIDVNSGLPSQVAISDSYIDLVNSGKISVKQGKIEKFNESGFLLSDQTSVEVDTVVFSTGYKLNLSFLDISLRKTLEFEYDDQLQPILLYKCTFHPTLADMAFVGVYRGPYFAVMELQARWASMVFSNKVKLPSNEIMEKAIHEERLIREQTPRPQFPHGDYLGLADSIAEEIGCLPDFDVLQKTDEKLYEQLWRGPVLPSHYRLTGPDSAPHILYEQLEAVAKILDPENQDKNRSESSTTLIWMAPVSVLPAFVPDTKQPSSKPRSNFK